MKYCFEIFELGKRYYLNIFDKSMMICKVKSDAPYVRAKMREVYLTQEMIKALRKCIETGDCIKGVASF